MPSLKYRVEAATLRALMGLPQSAQVALSGKPIKIDGQRLAPELQLMLLLQKVSGQAPLGTRPLAESRSVVREQASMAGGQHRIGAVKELMVPGAAGPMRARLYVPSARLREDSIPTLMFIHGGGMAVGDLDTHDAPCRLIAEASGVQVLSIDYRLAPEDPFPAGVQDCIAAYRWLVENAASVHADPARLAVGGDSAGGYLSATTALQAAAEGLPMAFQLLLYPVTDFINRSRSRELFDGGGFYLTREGMDRLSDWYLPDPASKPDPLVTILGREEFPPGLAPALVVTAGFDPLRDEGEAYGEKLRAHGVAVEQVRYPRMIHGFINVVGVGAECRANTLEIAAKLRAALA